MTRVIGKKTFDAWVLGGYVVLLAFLMYTFEYGDSSHPIGMVLSAAPLYALVVFSIASFAAAVTRTRRPLGVVDLVRLACWTVAAAGFGVSAMAGAYYSHYWPQYSGSAQAAGWAVSGVSLLLIVTVSLLYPTPKRHPDHCRPACGYDLTGNVSGVCPECGKSIGP